MSATTKASDWHAAKLRGERLPQHRLDDDPDPLDVLACDECGGPCGPDDWCPVAGMTVCPECLETFAEQAQ